MRISLRKSILEIGVVTLCPRTRFLASDLDWLSEEAFPQSHPKESFPAFLTYLLGESTLGSWKSDVFLCYRILEFHRIHIQRSYADRLGAVSDALVFLYSLRIFFGTHH